MPAQPPPRTTEQHLSLALSHPEPGTTVCTVAGEIDLASAPTLSAQLRSVLATQPARLIIDITAVTLLGAAGVHALEDIDRHRPRHTDLSLVYTGEPARTVLTLCGITDRIRSFTNLDTALTRLTTPEAEPVPHVPRQRTEPLGSNRGSGPR